MRQGLKRVPVPSQVRPRLRNHSFPAPTRGWITNEPLASSKQAGARVLENWFPTNTNIRLRGGTEKYATIGSNPVLSMWVYNSGSLEEFFAADEDSIFPLSTIADPDVAPTADVTGQASGYYSTSQIGTAGGDYLYAVNGTDSPQLYDGSTWVAVTGASTPAITGVTTSTFSHVSTYASRLYFVEKDTMNVWYLPVDSIGGAANVFSLAGIFQEGGAVLFTARWSLDSGDGLDDKFVIVSNKGEVAVYQGLFPGDSTWSKVGVYKITEPLGLNATMQAGGDLLIATEDGIVPLSQVLQKDVAALSLAAVTQAIEPEWKKEVVARRSLPWEILKWPSNNMMVVSLPVPDAGIDPYCFVANLETGAWCKFTGWETRSMALFNNFGYYGNNSGTIYKMEVGGSDDGANYVCTYVGLPDHLKTMGATKVIHNARSTFLSNVPFTPKISMSVNYVVDLPTAPSSVTNFTTDEWDAALWDTATWDSQGVGTVTTRWVSIGQTGFTASPQVQITCGVTPFPRTELISYDVLFEAGGFMV